MMSFRVRNCLFHRNASTESAVRLIDDRNEKCSIERIIAAIEEMPVFESFVYLVKIFVMS